MPADTTQLPWQRWCCYFCQSTRLSVEVKTYFALDQPEPRAFLTTEPDKVNGDHEWDEDSHMICRDCGKVGTGRSFLNPARGCPDEACGGRLRDGICDTCDVLFDDNDEPLE